MNLFNEQYITESFRKHVIKDRSYFEKYEKLPLEFNNKKWKWEGKDFPRVWCVLDFKEWIKKHKIDHFSNVLATCDSDPELEYISYDKISFAEYSNGQNDLHTLDLPKKDFDFVIFNQTLEHLYNPLVAMMNIYDHMAKGAYLFTSVPTINIPHMLPFHYGGLTPIGLSLLCETVGLKTIELGMWGNLDYIKYIFSNQTWPDYRVLIKDGIIKNEPVNHAQCWILARKP